MPLRKDPSRLLLSVVDLAKAAGQQIMSIYDSDFRVSTKEDDSPLTAADLASHHCLVEGLEASRSALGEVSERLARRDVDAFQTQGRFIQSKYGEPGAPGQP